MRIRIVGVVLVVLLGVGLLIRISDHSGEPSQESDRVAVEIPAQENLLNTETVDLRNGNIHLQIPVRVAHQKASAARSNH